MAPVQRNLQRRKCMAENREYKSDVFSMLLEEPEYALDVYNVLNGTDYDNPEEVKIFLLEKGVSLSIRNDASFIIFQNLNLYEHQSMYNPNVPLRNLIYLVNLLKKLIHNRDLYGKRLVKIPTPRFAVFYNGTEARPEVEELRLSDAFEHQNGQPEVELICKVYNINKGMNTELLHSSKVLQGYMYFVEKVRYYEKKCAELTEGINRAIDDCIKEGILEKFFREHRTEVIKVANLDYTWERREQLIRAEEYEEGVETLFETTKRLQQGILPEQIVAEGIDEKVVHKAQLLLEN